MFDSITPYNEIFLTPDFSTNKKKIMNKGNWFYEVDHDGDKGYRISRIVATDPNLYLDIKNSPGQKFLE